MKLLFDENLSHRLVPALADIYPGSKHLRDIGLVGADDERVWAYACEHGYVLTSKDADFYQRSILRGSPPKVIWLRIGNASTNAISQVLRERHQVIHHFVEDQEATFLALGPT